MFSKNKKNKSGMSLPVIIIGITIASAIIASTTSWLLSLNAKVSNIDGHLEAMTVATSEWNRLNAMSMDDLEAQKDVLSNYTVGDYQIMVDLGDKGKMEGGKCQTSGVAEGEKNCYNDSKVTIRKDGETLYTSKLLPLTAGGSGGSGKVPELDWDKKYEIKGTVKACSSGGSWGYPLSSSYTIEGDGTYTLPQDSFVIINNNYDTKGNGLDPKAGIGISYTINDNKVAGDNYYAKGTQISFIVTSLSSVGSIGGYPSTYQRDFGAYIIPVK